jgi:hypothetical protein
MKTIIKAVIAIAMLAAVSVFIYYSRPVEDFNDIKNRVVAAAYSITGQSVIYNVEIGRTKKEYDEAPNQRLVIGNKNETLVSSVHFKGFDTILIGDEFQLEADKDKPYLEEDGLKYPIKMTKPEIKERPLAVPNRELTEEDFKLPPDGVATPPSN